MNNLSKLAAGTMNWGTWGKNLSPQGMTTLIQACIENGITTFDHADIYGGYTTEAQFGAAFYNNGISRSSVQFVTKCGIQYPCEGRDIPIKHYDYSKSYIIRSVENSLRNLRTDYVDLLLLHRPSPLMIAEEIAEAVAQLKTAGKLLNFGLSNFTASQTDLIRQEIPVLYNQIQFSVTHNEAMTNGSLDHMQVHGITPMAWNPLGNVFRDDTEQSTRLKELLVVLQEKYNASADVILLAWILKHPAGIIPVFGTADVERIKNVAKATEIILDKEDWFSLWVESRGCKVP
ncbi:MAG TPA: aldo/keto reductase [Flavobacterium sp.]|jgi:predicted oxidoreductase